MNRKTLLIVISVLFFFPAILRAGWENKSFTFEGNVRDYRVYTPVGFSSSNTYSLVIGIHGLGDNMTNFSNAFTDFCQIADTANIILVYPQGMSNFIGNGWNAGAGTLGIYPSPTINDVGFINALTDTIHAAYPTNVQQTYLFGFSNGGFMVQRMACESNGKFAAIASLAGTLGNQITSCNPARKIPILHFHGTADVNVGYYNTPFGLSVDSLMALWAGNNACNTPADSLQVPDTKADGFTVVHYIYGGCSHRVELFKINGMAHILMNENNHDIGYAPEMWRFFRPHSITTGINTPVSEQAQIKLFPVPANETLTIELQSIENYGKLKLSVWDYSGRKITELSENTSGLYHFDCRNLSSGIYLVKANDGFRNFTTKFTVVR